MLSQSFAAGWYPARRASASVMYLPCLVLPYHFEPRLWKTLESVLTHTRGSVAGVAGFAGDVASVAGFALACFAEEEFCWLEGCVDWRP